MRITTRGVVSQTTSEHCSLDESQSAGISNPSLRSNKNVGDVPFIQAMSFVSGLTLGFAIYSFEKGLFGVSIMAIIISLGCFFFSMGVGYKIHNELISKRYATPESPNGTGIGITANEDEGGSC